ncbi:MAG: acyl-CoA dehydratase activase-related protein, partial [Oscillospiraceae bacterium]
TPLFSSKEEYTQFKQRHKKAHVEIISPENYVGNAYLGIDAGSTTVKAVIIDESYNILSSFYKSNNGNPVPIIKTFLEDFYCNYPNITIKTATSTGYGEDIIKNALSMDYGIVETMAHFQGASHFMSDVEFIIDIGGQDIKCFKIDNGIISDIFLNEACSSGCGSFLQTFANALGYDIETFAKLGLFADKPVDLGSRCTVFMNSSVKQAQKDGAKIENISAGLSSSIVKNALYKVVRATDPSQLGKKIVVQGGTFLNDAVLRAFEQELNINVVRPSVAGLMGAFGCAIYSLKNKKDKSNLISKKEIENFIHDVKTANCGLCNNNCTLTINTFGADKKYISGNKCERPITKKSPENEEINLFDYKINLLKKIIDKGENSPAKRGIIGIPLVLNMFELLSFWQSFFQTLGFCVKTSPLSNREIYIKGQSTIQSDTICYPAKLVHGHIEHLINETLKHENEKIIFYPCLSYNFDEKISDNHFNCPVVAYYPEVIGASMSKENDFLLIKDYFGIDKKSTFPLKAYGILKKYFPDITLKEVKQAAKNAYLTHEQFENKIIEKGLEI